MISDITKGLETLGNRWRKEEIELCKVFLMLSSKCAYREVTNYRTDVSGKKYYAFTCLKKDGEEHSHDWACKPTRCPLVGYLPVDVWDKMEEKAEEHIDGRS